MPLPRFPRLSNIKLAATHPAALWRIAKSAGRVLLGEKRPLRGVEFAITYRCELDCEHCLTKPLIRADAPEMSTEEAVRATGDLARFGVLFVNFTGGEALLREDIFDILAAAARHRGLLATLASNGLRIDRETAARIRRSGVAIVTMSLDGPDAARHDASRGRAGAFDALMRAVENLNAERVPIWFTTILTKSNAADGSVFKSAELARRLGTIFTVNWAYAVGRHWSGRDPRVSDIEERAFKRLMAMPHVRWEGSSNYRARGCPAGSEKIYVTPYGDVFPCAVIQSSFGNMLREPIRDIWRRMGEVPAFDGGAPECLAACDDEFIRTHFDDIRKRPGACRHAWHASPRGTDAVESK